ncbi:hypothetical protein [Brasilonema sp. UFV-L1]|uniref:hypothetical protein n=1 Tax=Brasilonema sp. UFV-L1 TaxID=2234130 RepID=UPI00145D5503|nr:hypothetical protein [Brasilonema sp. UFV-L1]NMG09504.1 hypothetical protein [Brasilonema sp. UFV-L1]
MSLTLIGWILLTAAGLSVVTFVFLYWSEIKNWFAKWNKHNLTTKDRDDVGFTLAKKIEANKYKTIQGVFNKKTNEVKDGRVIYAKQVDDQLIDDDADKDGTLLLFE